MDEPQRNRARRRGLARQERLSAIQVRAKQQERPGGLPATPLLWSNPVVLNAFSIEKHDCRIELPGPGVGEHQVDIPFFRAFD